MSFQWLSQENIRVDWDMNPRERDEDHIRTLASHMNEKGYDAKFPIIVYKIKTGSMAIKDTKGDDVFHAATGHHRLAASLLRDDEFRNLPLLEVYCEIREGTRSEYVRWMLVDNFQHTPGFNRNIGKTPTRKELQQMRFQLLFFPDVFGKGDRLLADKWGCDHKTVGEVRNWFISKLSRGETPQPAHVSDSDIEEIKEIIESDLYLGKDGKKYPRRTAQAKPQEEKSLLAKWNSEYLHRIADIFKSHGVSDNSATANIGRAIKRFHSKTPYEMSDLELEQIIGDAWIINEHPRDPIYWTRKNGDKIEWANYVLSLAKPQQKQSQPPALEEQKKQTTPTPKRFYAQIIHANKGDAPYSHTNELHFPTRADREKFGKEFVAYHDSHEHDGQAPEFKVVKSSDLSAGHREQAKKMIRNDEEGWGTDYDGWFRQELKSKISYFKPTCIIPEIKYFKPKSAETVLDNEADYPRINNITISIEKDGKEVGFYFYADELEEDDERSLTDIPKQILDQLLNLVINLEGKDNE